MERTMTAGTIAPSVPHYIQDSLQAMATAASGEVDLAAEGSGTADLVADLDTVASAVEDSAMVDSTVDLGLVTPSATFLSITPPCYLKTIRSILGPSDDNFTQSAFSNIAIQGV